MNFLIVIPRYVSFGKPYNLPLGLAYISSSLKANGFNVSCLNLCHNSGTEDNNLTEQRLFEYITTRQIDVVCTGGLSISFDLINEILEISKKIKPGIITIVGGAIVTANPRLTLKNMKIDIGVIGEGEETIVELAYALSNGKDIRNIKGIAYKDKTTKNIIITEPRGPITDLDKLVFPDYEGIEFDKYIELTAYKSDYYTSILDDTKVAYIITSRSCPYSCTFCYHPLGKRYRQRSLENVFREIIVLVQKYNINMLVIYDELFSVNKEMIR